MILEVQHETRFEYSEPVMEAVAKLRLEPVSDLDQSCRSFHLAVHPETEIFRYQGGFGNRVHPFNLLREHRAVRILAASVVETHPRALNLASSAAVLPLPLESAELEVLDFLPFRGPVRATPGSWPYARVCNRRTEPPLPTCWPACCASWARNLHTPAT